MTGSAGAGAGAEFDDGYMNRMARARTHWWVRGMQRVGAATLGRLPPDLDVLDLGCGVGANLSWLDELRGRGHLQATDIAAAAVTATAQRGIATSVTRASMDALPYRSETFDLVVNSDVLQHLPEGRAVAALQEVRRALRPGGVLLIRVNGDSFRRGVPERGTWRLYRPSRLSEELRAAGLVTERCTYASSAPALVAATKGAVRRARGSVATASHHAHDEPGADADGWGLGIPEASERWTANIGQVLLAGEAALLRVPGTRLPFGHAVVARARRPA